MILVVTISIALGVLLLIKLLIDSSYIAAILLVILFLIGWFIFNAFFGLTVFIKSNMRIYFASRIRGGSHEWAMRRVIESRYSISREKRDYVKLNILDKFSLDQSEEYQLKVLVYKLLCYEHKPPPTAYVSEEIQKQIDDIYDSLRKKYAFKEKEIDLKKEAKAYFDQGISCINDKQDWDLAMAEFDKALSIDPDYAEAYVARGNCWYFAGDHEQAMSDYSRAIKVNPNFYGAYSRRASLLSERGDLDGSISDMTKVIELNPENGTCQ